ncbi:MAG: hypothetical protein IAA96_07560 [Spirochaetes bacterium]|uniref:Uncharacterized protein n=1 Tax=Candidatus Avitreponema avistercoris TaxID=2840705 RepID=A0A9D9HGV0_9SPIR|nr:hypothetical protein [Candidatus Avitreponema avistercoris]
MKDATKNVYLAIKGDVVIHHTDLSAMKTMDGISVPDMTITEEEFEAAGGLVRLIDGKIFLGKTDVEKASEEAIEKIRALKMQLAETDYIASKIAEGSATTKDYAEKIAERQEWRAEINRLEKLVI